MRIHCPHCHNGIEVLDDSPLTDIKCDSCNSHFNLVSGDSKRTFSQGDSGIATIGRFELINEVGVGAFGTVWRGKDPSLDRPVAIKFPRNGQLSAQENEQFFREARAAAQLHHPNIVPVHEIGRDAETVFIVSEFVEGITLADRLTATGMNERDAARLCSAIAGALHHAHEHGVIHRDLKPSNIMLDEQATPYLMDFGLAKREAGEITMTVEGRILGTPAYMSPEQASGFAHSVDRRTDIYSVGVILFELLCGALPFRGNQRMLIHQVIHDEPPDPLSLNSNLNRDLSVIALKCLEKSPERRYETAQRLQDDLDRWLRGEPIHARPVGRWEKAIRWCRRNRAAATAIILALALIGTLAIGGPLLAYQQIAIRHRVENHRAQTDKSLQASQSLRAQIQTFLLKHPDDPEVRQVLEEWREFETSKLATSPQVNDERSRAQSYENLAALAFENSDDFESDLNQAVNHLQQSLMIRQRLYEQQPDNSFLARELAITYRMLAEKAILANDFAAATNYYSEQFAIYQTRREEFRSEAISTADKLFRLSAFLDDERLDQLVTRQMELLEPSDPEERYAAIRSMALALANPGLGDADRPNEWSHRLFERLAAEFPEKRQTQLDVAYSFGLLGDWALDAQEFGLAAEYYAKEIHHLEAVELSEKEQRGLSDAYVRTADLYVQLNELSNAEKLFEKDFDLWKKRATENPNPNNIEFVAYAHGKLAGIAIRREDYGRAKKLLQSAIGHLQSLSDLEQLGVSASQALSDFREQLEECEQEIRLLKQPSTKENDFDF